MAAVPETAVARLHRLEAKVEGWRAEYRELQDGFQHARAEAGRLEGLLQNPPYARGRRLEVDDEGRVIVREVQGHGDAARTVIRQVDDATLATTGRAIARLRREAADLAARRDALAEKMHPFAQLADARRRELTARGWQEGEYAAVQQGTALGVRGAA